VKNSDVNFFKTVMDGDYVSFGFQKKDIRRCVHADRTKLIPNAFSLYFIIGHYSACACTHADRLVRYWIFKFLAMPYRGPAWKSSFRHVYWAGVLKWENVLN
jgi:hypothetical protein